MHIIINLWGPNEKTAFKQIDRSLTLDRVQRDCRPLLQKRARRQKGWLSTLIYRKEDLAKRSHPAAPRRTKQSMSFNSFSLCYASSSAVVLCHKLRYRLLSPPMQYTELIPPLPAILPSSETWRSLRMCWCCLW